MPTPKTITFTNDEVEGYKFAKADPVDLLAYLALSEKEAQEILADAQRNAESLKSEGEKRKQLIAQHISDTLKQKARTLDTNLEKGFRGILDTLNNPDVTQENKNLCALTMLKNLGINVHAANVKTHYHKGPPEVYQITFVLSPQPSIGNTSSRVHELARAYRDGCAPDEAEKFNTRWEQHKVDANNTKPLMDPKKFTEAADESFNATVQRRHREEEKDSHQSTHTT